MNKQEKELKKEAEKIALEEFNQEKEEHLFSTRYNERKALFLNNMEQKNSKKITWTTQRIVLAAAIALFAIPSSVYAATKLYQWYVTKNNYQVSLSLNSEQTDKNKKYYQLALDYLPKGMTGSSESNKYSYQNNLDKGGLTFQLWKINKKADFDVLFTEDYQEETYNGHPALLVNMTKTIDNTERDFNRRAYLLFEKEGYVLETFIGSNVPNEEISKILTQVSLKESDKAKATPTTNFDDYQQRIAQEKEPEPQKQATLAVNSPTIHKIGETVTVKPYDNEMVKLTIDNVDLLSSTKSLNQNNFSDYFIDYLNEEKMINQQHDLLPFKQKKIKTGDGKETVDQVLHEKTVQPKFVYLTATIENINNKPLADLYLQDTPKLLVQDGKQFVETNINTNKSAFSGEVDYLDNHGEGKSFYRLPTLAAKEKRTLHFGFFIDDYQAEQMFLPIFNYGNEDLDSDKLTLIDIRP